MIVAQQSERDGGKVPSRRQRGLRVVYRRCWLVCIGFLMALEVHATGIPVVDVLSLIQSTITAMEDVAQTLKQIEEYRTQLQQYENQLRNTLSPPSYEWAQAEQTIHRLINAIDTLDHYKQMAGTLDGYLKKYRDLNDYRNESCFTTDGCQAQMEQIEADGSDAQKRANDALIRGIDVQQTQLMTDSAKLDALQRNTETAQGQMEALQYANQFAGHQTNQLLQIRGLLLQQQSASVAYYQTLNARTSLQQAADEKARAGQFYPSTKKKY